MCTGWLVVDWKGVFVGSSSMRAAQEVVCVSRLSPLLRGSVKQERVSMQQGPNFVMARKNSGNLKIAWQASLTLTSIRYPPPFLHLVGAVCVCVCVQSLHTYLFFPCVCPADIHTQIHHTNSSLPPLLVFALVYFRMSALITFFFCFSVF